MFIYRHMFFTVEDQDEAVKLNVDQFMDSYARDITVDELKEVGFSRICSVTPDC